MRRRSSRSPASAATTAIEPLEGRLLMARFAVIGDLGDNSRLDQVAAMVKGWGPSHVVTVGDNDNIDHTNFESTVGQHFHDWMSPYLGSQGPGSTTGNKFWPAMGNHDWESSQGSKPYTDYFTLPGVERYYSVRLSDTEFFMYDSDTREPHGTSATSTQGTWLRNAMAASTARWKIVIVHHAPYTSGTEPDGTWARLPFAEWGATAVLSGHQHNYERLNVSGTPYIVVGPAGATTGGGFGSIDSRSVVRYNAEHGAMMIDTSDAGITFKFLNRLGTQIDSFTVGTPAPAGPNAPSGLAASAPSASQVNLTWTDNSTNETGFRIERSTNGTTFTEITTVAAGVTSYADTGRTAGVTYTYRVRAYNAVGNSTYSNTAAATPGTAPVTFIPANATWKYLDNGTNQGAAWRALAFDDAAWKSGAAQLGYGDGDEATVVGYGGNTANRYITTYFRKTFNVTNPAAVTALTLRLMRDDGAVVYLNGAEIFRNNMPTGTIASTTLATNSLGGADETAWLTQAVSAALLQNGTNVLAVEIHQSSAGSSDITFNAELTAMATAQPLPPAPAAPGPLTATASGTSVINLVWQDLANNEEGCKIERSATGSGSWQQIATVAAGVTGYSNSGLGAGQTWFYRVRAYNGGGDSAYGNTASATTAAAPPPPPPGSTVYLSDIPWVGTPTNGYGPVEKDTGNGSNAAGDGSAITLNGVVYPKGLGAHASSTITYALNGAYVTFLSDVGVDDRQTTGGSIVFQVFLDGVKVYDSGVMGPATATKAVNLNVAGKNELRLVITDAGDGTSFDHGDWAGARLLTNPTPTPGAPSAPSAFSANALSAAEVRLTWVDNVAAETGFRIERSTNGGATWAAIATLDPGATSYSDTTVDDGTGYAYRCFAFNAVGDSVSSSVAHATTPANNALPAPWQQGDLGTVAAGGNAEFDADTNTFTVDASGTDIWTTADGFRFVYQPITGDATILARVAGTSNSNAWAKSGVMFRETLAANAKQASMHVTPTSGTVMAYRTAAGAASSGLFAAGSAPEWLRIVRSGSTFTASRSENGTTWTPVGSVDIPMAATIYLGLAVTARSSSVMNTTTFTNVAVTASAAAAMSAAMPRSGTSTFSTSPISALALIEEDSAAELV